MIRRRDCCSFLLNLLGLQTNASFCHLKKTIFASGQGFARHLHDPGGSQRSMKILESEKHFYAIVADGLFGPKQTFYCLPKLELKQLEEILRSRVLAMLRRAGKACPQTAIAIPTGSVCRQAAAKPRAARSPQATDGARKLFQPISTSLNRLATASSDILLSPIAQNLGT